MYHGNLPQKLQIAATKFCRGSLDPISRAGPTCSRTLRAPWPTFFRALRASSFTCSRASRASCSTCSCVSRALCPTCSHVSSASCATCSYASHALCFMYSRPSRASYRKCSTVNHYEKQLLLKVCDYIGSFHK